MGVVAVGLGLRQTGLGWDEYTGLNADERYGVMVVGATGLPGDVPAAPAAAAAARIGEDGYFATAGSALNPRNTGRSWVWGDLPPMLATLVLRGNAGRSFSTDLEAARQLTVLADLVTLLLVILLALESGAGEVGALLAGMLFAVAPLALQHAHFFVVDPFGTAAVTAALAAACWRLRRDGIGPAVAAGAAVGLAVACKATMVAVAAPVAAATLASPWLTAHGTGSARRRWWRGLAGATVAGATALVVFRLVHPYAFAGPGLLDVALDPRWWRDLMSAAAQQRSAFDAPWSWQWVGRSPWYLLVNLVRWAVGPALATAVAIGLGWSAWRGLGRGERRRLVAAGWVVLVVAAVALTAVKSIRYVLPAVPAMAVVAGSWLEALIADPRRRRLGVVLALVVAVATAGSGVAVVALHHGEHPRLAATRWIRDHVPAGAVIANETRFDEPVPCTALVDGAYRDSFAEGRYRDLRLGLVQPDGAPKLRRVVQVLSEADWLVMSSERQHLPMTRLPERFPLTTAYYRELLAGRLGFELVATFRHRLRWFGLVPMDDSRAEEGWRVSDHPVVRVFRKTPEFDPRRVEAVLAAALPGSRHGDGGS